MFEEKKAYLIDQAVTMYHVVVPCSNKSSLHECFTVWDDCLIFWFNTTDHDTHILLTKVDERQACLAECFSEETATSNGSFKSRLNSEVLTF